MAANNDTLQDRIARLERQIRTLAALCIGLPCLAFFLGADTAERLWSGKKVTAEEIVLVNAEGELRAKLSTPGGNARLTLYDENDKPRVLVGAAGFESGPNMTLLSSGGTAQLIAGIDRESDVGSVYFLHKNGQLMERAGGSIAHDQ
jgi:hypothetical protein